MYLPYLTCRRGVRIIASSVGLITILTSSIIATRELDVKKIIALSTLRQVGFIFLISGLNLLSMSYFHLLSHAFYKSCIFVFIGITLLASFHQQDKRYLINILAGLRTHVGLILTLARLSGLAFTSGLVSKECVVNIAAITSMSFNVVGGVFFCIVLTMIYRARVLVAINSSYSPVIVTNRIVCLIIIAAITSNLGNDRIYNYI